jgi:hypothetical protein
MDSHGSSLSVADPSVLTSGDLVAVVDNVDEWPEIVWLYRPNQIVRAWFGSRNRPHAVGASVHRVSAPMSIS